MKEASLVKFYFAKYFFLAFGLLQALAVLLVLIQFKDSPKNRFAAFVLFTVALILFSAHLIVFSKVKRVAISKKKICVIDIWGVSWYDWDKVKELKLLPFLNMYSLKLKGKRKIYFLPTHHTQAIYGMFQSEPEFIPKKMSKA